MNLHLLNKYLTIMNSNLKSLFDKIHRLQGRAQELETVLLSSSNVVRIGAGSIPSNKFNAAKLIEDIKKFFFNKYPNSSRNVTKTTHLIQTLEDARKNVRNLNLKYLDLQKQLISLERGVETLEKQANEIERDSLNRGLINQSSKDTQYGIDNVNSFSGASSKKEKTTA